MHPQTDFGLGQWKLEMGGAKPMTDYNGFTYEALSDEARERLVQEHLAQLEAEHWTATLNKRRYEQVTMSEEERRQLVDQADQQLARLEEAIKVTRAERDKLRA
jgi:tripartite-type tricarboxylate transporter receptor subunit TctC